MPQQHVVSFYDVGMSFGGQNVDVETPSCEEGSHVVDRIGRIIDLI